MFWKVFFFTNLIVALISYVTYFYYPKDVEITLVSSIQDLSTMLGVLCLYGLAYKRTVFRYEVWFALIPIMFLVDVIYPTYLIYQDWESVRESLGFEFWSVIAVLLLLVVYISVYFYG